MEYDSLTVLCDWPKKISRDFLKQSEVKRKPIVSYSHEFSRAWRRLRAFASSSDWFIGLSASCCTLALVSRHSNENCYNF